jgi:site-specific DNA-methyltransferase (adenine-specific)
MIELENAVVYHGSNLDVLPTLADNSVDAIVTDPPYELGFMGKSWDSSGIAYSVELWRECLRVLKPGGHLLAFGGSRTWHRIAVAIEDAGFDVRDSIAWLYGSGFPKSLDISKAIDKAAGAEREVVTETVVDLFGEHEVQNSVTKKNTLARKSETGEMLKGDRLMGQEMGVSTISETLPATDEAKKWQGWGTALKPAFEPVVVARKPLVGTVAANILEWGVGGLNIDGSRIGTEDDLAKKYPNGSGGGHFSGKTMPAEQWQQPSQGRWPANIILDEYTAGLLDEQSGDLKPATSRTKRPNGFVMPGTVHTGELFSNYVYPDSGGASRFFYVAKASKKDRNEGLDDLEGKKIGAKGNGLGRTCATCSASVLDGCECADRTFVNPTRQNFHPTVKPTALMEYLVKLVTPPGGTVLDPFTGSGSTGKAALLNGFKFIGIELTAEYLPIIKGRLEFAAQTFEQQATEKETKESETLF